MKWITVFAITLCVGMPAFPAPPVPRPAKEFTITQPSGKQSLLSHYRGKVVLLQFLYTTCVHCQAAARTYSKLQTEFGSRGFQALGVAFNPEAQGRQDILNNFVKSNDIGFPVGTASAETVLSYLGISFIDRFMVPQIMLIDRKGVVRAQSDVSGSDELQSPTYLRSVLEQLLREGSATDASNRRVHLP